MANLSIFLILFCLKQEFLFLSLPVVNGWHVASWNGGILVLVLPPTRRTVLHLIKISYWSNPPSRPMVPYFSPDFLYKWTHPCSGDNYSIIFQAKGGDSWMYISKTQEFQLACYQWTRCIATDRLVCSLSSFFNRNMANHTLSPLASFL